MCNIDAIIIEDELFNRELICDFVKKLNSNYKIIGEAGNINSGYELIKKLNPDLIFLDIKMPEGSGFDLLDKFTNRDFEVIFITGFDEYAIKAFEYNAIDYVLKPIDKSKFKNTLDFVNKRFDNKITNIVNLNNIIKSYDPVKSIITKIPIHNRHEVVLLNIDDLMLIESKDGIVEFYTQFNERYSSSKKLYEFDFILEKYMNFVQIRKNAYINIKFIKSYSKGTVCEIKMLNNSVFEVSRRKKTEILAILDRK